MWNLLTWKSLLPWERSILTCAFEDTSTILTVPIWETGTMLKRNPLTGRIWHVTEQTRNDTRNETEHGKETKWRNSRKWIKVVRKLWTLALLQWRTLFSSVCITTCAFSSGDLLCTRGMNCSSITFFWSLLESVSMMTLFWKFVQILGNAQIWKRPLKNAIQLQPS